jgi:hypothetical protein
MFRLCGIAVAITLMSVTLPYRYAKDSLLMEDPRRVDSIVPLNNAEWITYMADVATKLKELKDLKKSRMKRDTSLLRKRISALEIVQKKMIVIATSGDYYKLEHTTWPTGETIYDPGDNRMKLTFYFAGDDKKNRPFIVASFLHEVVHACQYEEGGLAYRTDQQWALLRDVFDEVESYKAMFAYEPLTVAMLVKGDTIKKFEDIDTAWIRKVESEEVRLYEKYSAVPLDVESNIETVIYNEIPAAKAYLDTQWTNQKNIQQVPAIKHRPKARAPLTIQ